MMNKQTAIIIGSSTAIGFIGDMMIYSLAESKGKKFKLTVPKGMEAVKLLLLGIATGFVIDFAVKKITWSAMSSEEKELTKLADAEKKKIMTGKYKGYIPEAITWRPRINTSIPV